MVNTHIDASVAVGEAYAAPCLTVGAVQPAGQPLVGVGDGGVIIRT